MNTVVLGNGFVAKQFKKNGYKTVNKNEFRWPEDRSHLIKMLNGYDCVINTIAYTNTKEAIRNSYEVCDTNVDFVNSLGISCDLLDIKLVHISSGCIYSLSPYVWDKYPEDTPISTYTASKVLGEAMLDPDKSLIIRPRLIFGENPAVANLFDKISKFNKFTTVKQSMTSTQTLVEAIEALLKADAVGIYNVVQEGSASIMEVAEILGLNIKGELDMEELKQKKVLTSPELVLDSSKLNTYYEPRNILEEIKKCAIDWNKKIPKLENS